MLSMEKVISFRCYKSDISSNKIFEAERHLLSKDKVFILSVIPEFLLDYFLERFWKSMINVKNLNKRYCR